MKYIVFYVFSLKKVALLALITILQHQKFNLRT